MTKKIIFLSIASFCALAGILAASTQVMAAKNTTVIDIPCVKTTLEAREATIQTAFTKFSTTSSLALQTRANALSATWTITDAKQRNAAIKTAWATFKTSKQSATKTFRAEQSAAWKQFKQAIKACGIKTTGETQGNDISI